MAMICVNGCKECTGCGNCQEQKTYCDCCGERIVCYYYEINGRTICKGCLEELYRREVD